MKVTLAIALWTPLLTTAKDDGLALTPTMGWMSWERYVCNTDCETYPDACINEDLYMRAADLLKSEGYMDVGYTQVSIDDCWSTAERNSEGDQQADPARFPNGMKAVGDYLHAKGGKFGFYSDIGTRTCGDYIGMKGNFQRDIDLFASWGIDYLKLDGCNEDLADMPADYAEVSKILSNSGRDIVFSCSWPAYVPGNGEDNDGIILRLASGAKRSEVINVTTNPITRMLSEICHTWRNFDDVSDSWASVSSIIDFWKRNSTDDNFVAVSGPGSWNDADMLMVGNNGLSHGEERTQFALYAIFATPLFLSTDLLKVSDESKAILQNTEIIAVNQDASGQGIMLSEGKGEWWESSRVWGRALSNGKYAIVIQNDGNMGPYVKINFDITMLRAVGADVLENDKFSLRCLFGHKEVGEFSGSEFSLDVESSSSEMFIVTLL